jgi:hypothetical protein
MPGGRLASLAVLPSRQEQAGSGRLLVLRDIEGVDWTGFRVRVPLSGHVLSWWRIKKRAEASVVI